MMHFCCTIIIFCIHFIIKSFALQIHCRWQHPCTRRKYLQHVRSDDCQTPTLSSTQEVWNESYQGSADDVHKPTCRSIKYILCTFSNDFLSSTTTPSREEHLQLVWDLTIVCKWLVMKGTNFNLKSYFNSKYWLNY